jgi:hypothetical protein
LVARGEKLLGGADVVVFHTGLGPAGSYLPPTTDFTALSVPVMITRCDSAIRDPSKERSRHW